MTQVVEDRDQHGQPTGKALLCLVRETKDPPHLTELRPDEARKIRCGEKHFKEALGGGGDYKVVSSIDEIR